MASRIFDARWLAAPLVAALLALAPAAHAAPVDEATRAAARAAAEDALARFDKGDFAGALDLFNRADALVHAPTLGLMAARCLERLGRLVEASERYYSVTRVRLDTNAPESQIKAQATAEQERAALLPKVPNIVIALEGGAPADAQVTLDGKPIPAELLGLKRPTDPGAHRLAATRGAEVVTRDFVLKPGDIVTITLSLPNARATPGPGAVLPPPPKPGVPDRAPVPETRGLGAAGWAGIGVAALGGAGIVVGAITGGLAASAKSDLDAAGCASGVCPPSQQDKVSSYNTMRMVSGAGFIAGGILAAGGVTLAIVGSRGRAKPQARVAPWIAISPGSQGFTAMGVEGAF